MFEKSKLRSTLNKYRKQQYALNTLLTTFEDNDYDYAIVGGFVRRVLTNEWNGFSNFDIIVDIPSTWIKHIIKHFGFSFSENSNGGFSIKDDNNISIDIWSLQDHSPFIINYPDLNKSFKNIQKASIISIDGGTYMPAKNKLYWTFLRKSIKQNQIFCLSNPINYIGKAKIGARLIYLNLTTDFNLSDEAAAFCKTCKKLRSLNFKVQKYLTHILDKRGCSSIG